MDFVCCPLDADSIYTYFLEKLRSQGWIVYFNSKGGRKRPGLPKTISNMFNPEVPSPPPTLNQEAVGLSSRGWEHLGPQKTT